MMIDLMLFFDCIIVDGRSLFVGLVKTDLNWFNNNSAFPLLSLPSSLYECNVNYSDVVSMIAFIFGMMIGHDV
jgi:hypothetical protein